VRSIARSIKVGGKLAILIVHILEYCEHPEELEMHGTYVAEAFRDEYEREGNAFIVDNYISEADEGFLPAIEAGEIRRYLYVATV